MDEHDLALYRGMIAERDKEITLLQQAIVRYCDSSRMGTVEPQALQQAIDRAFEAQPSREEIYPLTHHLLHDL